MVPGERGHGEVNCLGLRVRAQRLWLVALLVTLAKQAGCPSAACSASAGGSGMHQGLREHPILAERPAVLLKSIFITCSLSIAPKQGSGPFAASSSPLGRWPEGLFLTCRGV